MCTGRDRSSLEQLVRRIGGSVVVADLADPAAAEWVVAHSVAEHGRLDAVVANAGVGYSGGFADMSAEGVSEIVDVNVRAPMLLAPPLLRSGGPDNSTPAAPGLSCSSARSPARSGCRGARASTRRARRPSMRSRRCFGRTPRWSDADLGLDRRPRGGGHRLPARSRRILYDRRFPRPMSPERVASVVVRALESGADRFVEPRWLVVPARLAATAPRLYRTLARRFG